MMEKLIECFERALKYNKYIYIIVSIFGKEEIIINKPENVEDKLNYYKNSYNEELELKTNTNIKIVK